MLKHTPVFLIGGGHLAQALLKGWQSSPLWAEMAPHLHVVERNPERVTYFRHQNIACTTTLPGRLPKQSVLILAVKPQDMAALATKLRPLLTQQRLISVAAGLRVATLQTLLDHADIGRAMPNLAAAVRQSFTGLWHPVPTSDSAQLLDTLFAALGPTHRVEQEAGLAEVTAIAGSGLAYWYQTLAALESAGQALTQEAAWVQQATRQTFLGAAALLQTQRDTPSTQLLAQIASKNGTTAAALQAIEKDLSKNWQQALVSAYTRAAELDSE